MRREMRRAMADGPAYNEPMAGTKGWHSRLSYANVVATLALFISLGGASYAAVTLPAGSVGPRQLRDGAGTPRALGFPLGVQGFTEKSPVVLSQAQCPATSDCVAQL